MCCPAHSDSYPAGSTDRPPFANMIPTCASIALPDIGVTPDGSRGETEVTLLPRFRLLDRLRSRRIRSVPVAAPAAAGEPRVER